MVGTINGFVKDIDTGVAISGVTVFATFFWADGCNVTFPDGYSTTTGANGWFEFTNITTGGWNNACAANKTDYWIDTSKPGYDDKHFPVSGGQFTLSDGATLWHLDLRIKKSATTTIKGSGYVTDDTFENYLPNVKMVFSNGPTVYTDANGYYEVTLNKQTQYTVTLSKTGYSTFSRTFMTGTNDYELSYVLTPTSTSIDFDVSLSTTNLIVQKGQSKSLTATFTKKSGTGTVKVFIPADDGWPAGFNNFTKSPNSGTPTFSSTITCNTTNDAFPGTYDFSVLGEYNNGEVQKIANFTVTVTESCLADGQYWTDSPTECCNVACQDHRCVANADACGTCGCEQTACSSSSDCCTYPQCGLSASQSLSCVSGACTKVTDTKWKCSNGVCVEAINGNFNSSADCQAACWAGKKYGCTNNVCVEDENGIHDDSLCGGACAPVVTHYKCKDGKCVQDANGEYTSISKCKESCKEDWLALIKKYLPWVVGGVIVLGAAYYLLVPEKTQQQYTAPSQYYAPPAPTIYIQR